MVPYNYYCNCIIHYYQHFQGEDKKNKIKYDVFIENQLKELEMKALKAQMNPHFIYNALNSIQALVANDKKMEGIHYIGSF